MNLKLQKKMLNLLRWERLQYPLAISIFLAGVIALSSQTSWDPKKLSMADEYSIRPASLSSEDASLNEIQQPRYRRLLKRSLFSAKWQLSVPRPVYSSAPDKGVLFAPTSGRQSSGAQVDLSNEYPSRHEFDQDEYFAQENSPGNLLRDGGDEFGAIAGPHGPYQDESNYADENSNAALKINSSRDATELKLSERNSSPKYLVSKGELLWHIARNELGDGMSWREIYALNPKIDPNRLEAGLQLVMPEGWTPSKAKSSRAKSKSKSNTKKKNKGKKLSHTVRKNESLSEIAASYYSDGRYARIKKANRIRNANHLKVGKKIVIPYVRGKMRRAYR